MQPLAAYAHYMQLTVCAVHIVLEVYWAQDQT